MKLIDKKDLGFRDGMVYEKSTGRIVSLPALASQVNELVEVHEIIGFVTTNRTEIEASGSKRLEFTLSSEPVARFESGKTVATPLADAAKADAEALAKEFLEVKDVEKIDAHLRRYDTIAEFIGKDYIVVADEDPFGDPTLFKVNPLTEVTEDFVLETVTAYHNPEMKKLIRKVDISE